MNRLRLIPLVSFLVFAGCAALLPFVEPDQQGQGFSTDERRFSMQSAPRKLPTRQSVRRPDRLTTLIHNLKHGNDVTRTHAAYWLGELGAQATPAISTLNGALLNDDSRWVRRASAKALGKIRSSESIDALISALRDRDKWVAHSAANALRRYSSSQQARRALSNYQGV